LRPNRPTVAFADSKKEEAICRAVALEHFEKAMDGAAYSNQDSKYCHDCSGGAHFTMPFYLSLQFFSDPLNYC
jgi:hypothetical protein